MTYGEDKRTDRFDGEDSEIGCVEHLVQPLSSEAICPVDLFSMAVRPRWHTHVTFGLVDGLRRPRGGDAALSPPSSTLVRGSVYYFSKSSRRSEKTNKLDVLDRRQCVTITLTCD